MISGSETGRTLETILGFGNRALGGGLSILMLAALALGCGAGSDDTGQPAVAETPSSEMTAYEIIAFNDRNGDGMLSPPETPRDMQAGFADMDLDGNGYLTASEIEAGRNAPASGAGGTAGPAPPATPGIPEFLPPPPGPTLTEEETCADQDITAVRSVPEVHLVVDRSSSMNEPASYDTKWVEACDAVKELVYPLTDQVAFGYFGYTWESGDCPNAVEVPAVTGNADPLFQAMLNGSPPFDTIGTTPTGEALNVVADRIEQTMAQMGENDLTTRRVLLITDGMPNGCSMDAVFSGAGPGTAEGAARRLCQAGIEMVVIWIGEMASNAGPHMQNMANLGAGSCNDPSIQGTYYTVQTGAQLQTILTDVVTGLLDCTVRLDGRGVDPELACKDPRSNVTLDGGRIGCGDHGWRLLDPNTMQLTGDACTYVKDFQILNIQAQFPCEVYIQ